MVVGTRYAAGVSTAGDWGLARVLNSRLATLLAVRLTACSDPMSGFFAVDRRALPDRAALRPVGYKIAGVHMETDPQVPVCAGSGATTG